MSDIVPKLTDISGLKAASTLLALPMLCVAYIIQDGATIGWDGKVWLEIPLDRPEEIQLNWLIAIFLIKSLWAAFWGVLGYVVLACAHHFSEFPILHIAMVLLLALGIFGVFGHEYFPQLRLVNTYWFYCAFVWALFFGAMAEQLDTISSPPGGT